MAELDALSNYQFEDNAGLFLKFKDGDEFKLRVLTTDPVVTNKEFTNPDGTISLSTRFAFIVYNFTLGKAQILDAAPTVTREIQVIHQDEDFGANIKKVDVKIKATGDKLKRRYSVSVLPKAENLTMDQIKECQKLNLDELIKDGQRMSFYKPEEEKEIQVDEIHEVPEGEEIDLDSIPF